MEFKNALGFPRAFLFVAVIRAPSSLSPARLTTKCHPGVVPESTSHWLRLWPVTPSVYNSGGIAKMSRQDREQKQRPKTNISCAIEPILCRRQLLRAEDEKSHQHQLDDHRRSHTLWRAVDDNADETSCHRKTIKHSGAQKPLRALCKERQRTSNGTRKKERAKIGPERIQAQRRQGPQTKRLT